MANVTSCNNFILFNQSEIKNKTGDFKPESSNRDEHGTFTQLHKAEHA